jgi:hypothetical protein
MDSQAGFGFYLKLKNDIIIQIKNVLQRAGQACSDVWLSLPR